MNYFIINLPQDIERREFLAKDMEKFNLNFSFVEAVDGRIIPTDEIAKYYNSAKSIDLFNREMTPGEIGCALSHNKIYRKIVSESIASAVILEDDTCIVDSDIGALLSDLEKLYPAEIPVIVLLNFVERYVSNKDDIIINEKYTLHDSYRSISSASYFITKSAAEILSKNLFPVYVVADKWEYYQEKFFPVKMIIPNCIDLSEKSLQSSISLRGDRRTKIKKKINFKYYFHKHLNTIIFSIFKKPFLKTKRQKRI